MKIAVTLWKEKKIIIRTHQAKHQVLYVFTVFTCFEGYVEEGISIFRCQWKAMETPVGQACPVTNAVCIRASLTEVCVL
jgi:hypothetical protein